MNEREPASGVPRYPAELQPGVRISLEQVGQLAEFEDAIYPYVVNDFSMAYSGRFDWQARLPLKQVLQVPRFHGRLGRVELEIMDDPVGRPETVRERYGKLLSTTGRSSNVTPALLAGDVMDMPGVFYPGRSPQWWPRPCRTNNDRSMVHAADSDFAAGCSIAPTVRGAAAV